MYEQKIITKELLKNMIYTLIAFTFIFTLFGFIIYNLVSGSIYSSADEELLNQKNRLGIIQSINDPIGVLVRPNISNNNLEGQEDQRKETRIRPNDIIEGYEVEQDIINEMTQRKGQISFNPRLLYIVRNEDGSLTEGQSSIPFQEEIIQAIPFNVESIEKIYKIILDSEYQYRAINYKEQDEQGNVKYIQVLVNVDAEEKILYNFTRNLIICIVIAIFFSILASYILSKRVLRPIMNAWKKQTEFVQNASHELRTPLTIIKAKQELLLKEPESKIIDKSEEINISLQETKRLTKLIKDLMVLARADSNNSEIKKERFDIDQFIKEITIPYIDFANMQEKKIELDLKYGKELNADKDKINQLFIILLDNAIKYTEEKDSITIKTQIKENKFILEIKDTGIGISEEGLKHIFERFYREDKARSRESGGTGLGLSIANYIVNVHGGSIKITHNETKGIVIIIKLPK